MKILFICTGNTCRSCMAEAIFNKICNFEDCFSFSAGVNVVTNSVTSKNSFKLIAEKLNIDISERCAIQLDETLIKEVDLVLAMSKSAKYAAINYFNSPRDITFTLNEYVNVQGEVSDPYGGDLSVYEKTYEQIEGLLYLLMDKLNKGCGISQY